MKQLKELRNIKEMIDYLETKGENHTNFYHYTNKKGLQGMLESGKLHISRGDRMNDRQELTKGDLRAWNKLYLASFNYGEGENMAMWGLYGIPTEDAIRITISGKVMREWIDKVNKVYRVDWLNGIAEYTDQIDLKSIRLTDVVYATGNRLDRNFSLKRSRESLAVVRNSQLGRISSNKMITGYIKNAAWSYENEVRIRIETESETNCNCVAIDIPDYVFSNMKLLYGPGYVDESDIDDHRFDEMEWENSVFRGLVNYRERCWFCKNEFERRL